MNRDQDMLEVKGNIWDYHTEDYPVVITTNGSLNSKKELVGHTTSERSERD